MRRHTPPATERLYFLDGLRILAFVVLVLYHVGMYYVSWDFHVKSPHAGPGLIPWMKLSAPWRMSLLFMISGAATATLLKKRIGLRFVRQRSARLLMPLLCGALLVVPPQSYFEVVQKFQYADSYWSFLKLYYTGYDGFCEARHCLILPTWNHLWFLPYVWAYTVLLCVVLAAWPHALERLAQGMSHVLRGWGMALVPTAWLFVLRVTLSENYPSTHALWGDWFNHAIYLTMFLIGAVFAIDRSHEHRFAHLRWLALGLALCFWALWVFTRPTPLFAHAVIAAFQWSALLAALGFAKTHLDSDSPLRQHLSSAIFPAYLLHQTVIIVMSQFLTPLQLPLPLEGALLIVSAFALSYAGFMLVQRTPILHTWFGIKVPLHSVER